MKKRVVKGQVESGVIRSTCSFCNREIRVCIPKGGDGSCDVFVRHKTEGRWCKGSRTIAKYI
jgi:hypothetical protein